MPTGTEATNMSCGWFFSSSKVAEVRLAQSQGRRGYSTLPHASPPLQTGPCPSH